MDNRQNLSGSCADAVRAIPEKRWLYLEYQESLSNQIDAYMETHGISRAELAKRLGTSRSYITKVLRGDANMTMETLVSLLFAMGAKPVTHIVERRTVVAEKQKNAILLLFNQPPKKEEAWPSLPSGVYTHTENELFSCAVA